MAQNLQNLQQLLDHIAELPSEDDRLSLGAVVESVGGRSFGPLLLIVGLTLVSPLSGIPGMAVFVAVFVMLIAVQMLIGRKHFWLPQWLLSRSISKSRLDKALSWLQRPARLVDRLIRPRLSIFAHHSASYVIAALCVFIALGLPFMELVPFTSSAVGVALTALGLSLVAHDGLLVLIAIACVGATFGVVAVNIL